MEFKENSLLYEDYQRLRESVEWLNFSEEQTSEALKNSCYSVTAVEENQVIGMGRLVGDGLYYTIVDIVVKPSCQHRGIGNKIIDKIVEYVDTNTPQGGRSSIQLIAEKGKEAFYAGKGFKLIPHEFCGSGMRKIILK